MLLTLCSSCMFRAAGCCQPACLAAVVIPAWLESCKPYAVHLQGVNDPMRLRIALLQIYGVGLLCLCRQP